MTKFKLKGYNEDEYFKVVVYDSLRELREAGNKLTPNAEPLTDALAVVQPYQRVKIGSDGSETVLNEIGTIRLVKNKLHTHIIAHELVHAAMWHYRLTQTNRKADFGEENSEAEEDFGMIYAKYFSKMSGQLYKYKLWS